MDDGPNVTDKPLALRLALSASAAPMNETAEPLLIAMLSPDAEGKGLDEFFTAAELAKLDTRSVVWFARSLGLRSAQGDALGTAYVTDILAALDRIPPVTATLLYLGLLCSSYLDGEEVRAIPRAPWLVQLLARQSQPFARIAIEAFLKFISGRAGRPVYLPNPEMPTLAVTPLLEATRGAVPRLTGLQIANVGVVIEAQDDASLRLGNRYSDKATVPIAEIVRDACATLGIPVAQIDFSEELDRPVAFGVTTGIAGEANLQNNMDESA